MTKPMTDEDRAALVGMIARYGVKTIEREISGKKTKRGRHADMPGNADNVWISVEVRRYRGVKLRPLSVRQSCDDLADDLRAYTGPSPPGAGRLRKMYAEAARRQKADPQHADRMAQALSEARASHASAGPGALNIPLLGRPDDEGGYRSLSIDRLGKWGQDE